VSGKAAAKDGGRVTTPFVHVEPSTESLLGRRACSRASVPMEHTKPIASQAYSTRYDVQHSYDALFFSRTEEQIAQASKYNSLAFEDFEDRTDGIEMLKRRLRAATRKHLADGDGSAAGSERGWSALFRSYDTDGNGELDEEELLRAVRRDLRIPEHELSRADLSRLFSMIDADNSGAISSDELVDFMRWESRAKLRSGHALALQAGDTDGAQQSVGYVVPFVAEYYVLKRMTLREGSSLNSRKIGMVSAGEIVAVTRTDGNRMRCERLSFGVRPSSGWCSEYAEGGSGEQLLEMLPRSEWGDGAFNDTAIAARVSALRSAEKLRSQARPTVERDGPTPSGRRRQGADNSNGSTYWEQHADETKALSDASSSVDFDQVAAAGGTGTFTARGVRASLSLADCRTAAEVDSALALLEATPRESWETALQARPKPASHARRRGGHTLEEGRGWSSSSTSSAGGAGSGSGDGSQGSSDDWVMAHPTPSVSLPQQQQQQQQGRPSAALSEKALAAAAKLEAIATSLREAGVRTDLIAPLQDAKASTLACLAGRDKD
jgi:hypothetical protein